ncbi:uncharacterized protein LOC133839176 isoform X1 [Drosophila sulfurigaster albostrigata]|uniref:uncharacterized protein LOC133839176 isoform X1 n=1 Tax=Drosophila sulfurigaster albostrigata TaxID=89887 RepID=UPI002D21DD2B|nr:uncharacterized protein LOC133839176 isoform X1 [Drosophila sulfurigaster albostrigata]
MAYQPKVPHIVGDDDGEEQQIPQNGNEYNNGELSELDDIASDEEDGEEGEDWSQNVHYIDHLLGYAPELEGAAANQANEFSYPAADNILSEIKDELESNEGNAESDYNIWKDPIDNKVEIESMVDPNEHSIQLAGNNDPPAMSRNIRKSTLVVQEGKIPSRRLRSLFRSKSENGYAPELKEAAANQADEFSYPAEYNILSEIKDELESSEGNAESDYNIWKDPIDNKVEIESMVDPNEHSIQLAGNNDPPAMNRNVRESTLVVQEGKIPSRRLRSSFRSKPEKSVSPITLPRSRQAAKTKVPTPILVSRRTPTSRVATKNMKRLREPLETLTVRPLDVTRYFTEISAQLVRNRLDEGAFMEMRDQIDRLVDEAIAKTKLFQKHPSFAPRSQL